MDDYEYLHRLVELGEGDFAIAEARALFPRSDDVSSATPELLYAARRRLAERIESLAAGP